MTAVVTPPEVKAGVTCQLLCQRPWSRSVNSWRPAVRAWAPRIAPLPWPGIGSPGSTCRHVEAPAPMMPPLLRPSSPHLACELRPTTSASSRLPASSCLSLSIRSLPSSTRTHRLQLPEWLPSHLPLPTTSATLLSSQPPSCLPDAFSKTPFSGPLSASQLQLFFRAHLLSCQ